MQFGLYNIITLLGALALFIYGMKIMSEAIQKVAGARMREVLQAMTANPLLGVFTGFSVTSLIQSSSATTVMIVSFVNAGLLNLRQSIAVIMGANLGTTITAWLVAILGLGLFSVTDLSLPILAIVLPLLFINREKVKQWGEVLFGFAILFLGLSFMRQALPDLGENPGILDFFAQFSYQGRSYLGQVGLAALFTLAGAIITLMLQSSSAAMALTLVLTANGWISFPLAAAIILGENIGTTVTANVAALVANVHAKRAARAHFLFNLFGAVAVVLFFPFFLDFIAWLSALFFNAAPFDQKEDIALSLSLFHTVFNLLNLLLFFNLIGFLAKVSTLMVAARGEEDKLSSLEHIGSSLMDTPELSMIEARKELVKFAELIRRAYKYIPLLITEMEESRLRQYVEKLQKYEDISDSMEMEISNYLSKISQQELSSQGTERVRAMLSVANYLERIGDIYLEVSRNLTNRKEQKAYFTPEMRSKVIQLSELVSRSLGLMVKNLEETDAAYLKQAIEVEGEIDKLHQELKAEYITKVEKGKYRIQSGMYYSDLLAEMERIADHAINISTAMHPRAKDQVQ